MEMPLDEGDNQNGVDHEPISLKRPRFDITSQLDGIRQAKKEKNMRIVQYISQLERLTGAPVIPLELISALNLQFRDIANRSGFFSSKADDPTFASLKADLFERACEIVSSRISDWATDAIRGFVFYFLFYNVICCIGGGGCLSIK